ncbi:MAG: deoxyhypusine synthase family protein [Candidatus ainarchaeum sp.]|jgi:deoxyhypusine synthase|nr:deoxyhypusine synthase family protein [Candidatus ainarchaeum sp.]NCP72117.1 deoxyhypusine synthase family protein [archaeon]NCP79292.1 deoxyhypusine synthase family protein [archaeon]NCP98249.1 deoxyhypusine synthase family protein [archaeon]NCQ07059.1 deoxyhypusine synthase family protein [archaeon]
MDYTKDFLWKENLTVSELLEGYGKIGFQSYELKRASDLLVKMKKEGAKVYFSFTSNMVTSGLRGFFAQLIEKKMCDVIVTTVGSIEEDIMKADGDKFILGSFSSNDEELYERGENRVGNILITNDQYQKLEAKIKNLLLEVYKEKKSLTISELLREIGLKLNDPSSILYQAAINNVPVFCPAITDGSFGFHLYLFKEEHKDFNVDIINDFRNIIFSTSHDEKKGIVALGGGVSKHHIILTTLINGGADYALYMTTASPRSGSLSGATTDEAKSWGKIKDNSDAVTVIGDVTITFPIAMVSALDTLKKEGVL